VLKKSIFIVMNNTSAMEALCHIVVPSKGRSTK
jgi:hypothetical protein